MFIEPERTLREKVRVSVDQFRTHGGSCQPPQSLPLTAFRCCDRNLHYFIDSHSACSPQSLDYGLRADALFHMVFDFLEDFTSQDNH